MTLVEVPITIKDLVKGKQYNGKRGKATNFDGTRFSVKLSDENKTLSIKPTNIDFEFDDLSVKQLKAGLTQKNVDLSQVSEKVELLELVKQNFEREENALQYFVPAKATPAPQTSAPTLSKTEMNTAAANLKQASPEQLRQQAQMIRSMGPAQMQTLRTQNPAFQNLTDEQIRQSADQIEMMANNPEMVKMATEQLEKGNIPTMGGGGISPEQAKIASERLKNSSPEQLRAQAEQIKNMTSAQIQILRSKNPDFQNMTDDQIRESANQMEKLADNPELLDLAAKQMEQNGPPTPQAAAKMMENMSGEDLKNIFKMQRQQLKTNPAMVEQLRNQSPMWKNKDVDELDKELAKLEAMDPEQLKQMIAMTNKLQKAAAPVLKMKEKVDSVTGGNSISLFVAFLGIVVCFIINYLFFS